MTEICASHIKKYQMQIYIEMYLSKEVMLVKGLLKTEMNHQPSIVLDLTANIL